MNVFSRKPSGYLSYQLRDFCKSGVCVSSLDICAVIDVTYGHLNMDFDNVLAA